MTSLYETLFFFLTFNCLIGLKNLLPDVSSEPKEQDKRVYQVSNVVFHSRSHIRSFVLISSCMGQTYLWLKGQDQAALVILYNSRYTSDDCVFVF